ncbi:MAG: hypothetical protein ACUVV5_09755 [Candidatus Aminicenantales bacterium]
MRGLFRLIFYVFVAYLIYLVIRFLFPQKHRRSAHQPPGQPSGMMVKDEMCNTYLPREDAILENIDGKEYFFCSRECRQKFLERKKDHQGDPSP